MKDVESKKEEFLYEKEGNYLDYKYNYTEKSNVVVVTFNPFLPRDDKILIGAIKELIYKVYNKSFSEEPSIELVNKNGINLLSIKSIDGDYFIQIFK